MLPKVEELQERLKPLKVKYKRGGALGGLAYAVLKDAILLGILPKGERLQERYLAEALGLSRTPVREAIKRLETEGLVEPLANGGVRVQELTLQDLEDIYELRIVLEGLAARLAAQRASASNIAHLKYLFHQMETVVHVEDIDISSFLNAQFHQAIAEASQNKHLAKLIAQFHSWIQCLKYATLSYPGRAQKALKEHQQLLEAIINKDSMVAEQVAIKHVKNAWEVQMQLYLQGTKNVIGGDNMEKSQ